LGSVMNRRTTAVIMLCSWSIGAPAREVPRVLGDSEPSPAALCALYQLDRQYERALQRCTQALGDGEDAEVYSNRGSAYLMIDEIDRAISDFDRAIQLEPDNAMRYYNRGIALSRKHQVQKAIDDYSRAIQLSPDLAPAYGNRAHQFELAGERDKAIADYRKALLLAPELRDVIGGHLRRLGAP
jgi:tetratricopeptide (TPR) repeat protein